MEQKKKLPLDVTFFYNMIDGNYIYVDKTDLIAGLATDGYPCFLSRPRRFGKSTLINTFYELFANGLQRFKGLKIERNGLYTDDKTYKVLRLNFATCSAADNIRTYLIKLLSREFKRNAIDFDEQEDDPRFLLESVIYKEENKSIVLLIDEYDSPLTQVLDNKEEFSNRRIVLQSFYSVVKDLSNSFRFIFITGITRYSNVSIFSDFNNLQDLSLNSKYGTLLGYTQEEIEFYFKDYIEAATCELNQFNNNAQYSYESVLQLLKQNYNGYCFDEQCLYSVYNPWSILNFLHNPHRGACSYWIETGGATPTLLVKYLKNKKIEPEADFKQLFNVDTLISVQPKDLVQSLVDITSQDFSLKTVLYQSGYLCIKAVKPSGIFMLGIPNLEVKKAFADIILDFLGQKVSTDFATKVQSDFYDYFLQKNFDKIKLMLNQLVNTLSYESVSKFNESIFRDLFKITILFAGANNIQAETPNAVGRSDLIFNFGDTCFVCEFKLTTRLTEVNTKLIEAEQQIELNDYTNLLGVKKVVPLAIVAVNQEKNSKRSAIRRFEIIKEVEIKDKYYNQNKLP